MKHRIAVDTLTFKEISDLFQESLLMAMTKASLDIRKKTQQLGEKGISNKWIETYEIFKGAKLNFYCQKLVNVQDTIVSIGMPYRTTKGMILITVDTSNGGITDFANPGNASWAKWVKVYTGHYCQRFAERIMNVNQATFQIGSEGIMFSDDLGPVRITDTIDNNIDEIEFQFKEGQAYGYRDRASKITCFRTVYSNEMLKRDRLNFKNEWEQSLDELYELFKWESNTKL